MLIGKGSDKNSARCDPKDAGKLAVWKQQHASKSRLINWAHSEKKIIKTQITDLLETIELITIRFFEIQPLIDHSKNKEAKDK
jgi:hypothetical protein